MSPQQKSPPLIKSIVSKDIILMKQNSKFKLNIEQKSEEANKSEEQTLE